MKKIKVKNVLTMHDIKA